MIEKLPEPTWCDEGAKVYLYQGDCLELLPLLPNGCVDTVVTDPPYGLNTKSDGTGKLNPWADLCNAALWYRAWLSECRRIARTTWSCLNWRSLVTFQKVACDLSWPIESLLVWDKACIGPGGLRGLRPSYELVALWCSGGGVIDRGLADVQQFKWASRKPHGHPAEKPTALMRWCIKAVGAQSVIDPFMGSGTTGVASIRQQASFVGIEIDEACFSAAVDRIRNEIIARPLPGMEAML